MASPTTNPVSDRIASEVKAALQAVGDAFGALKATAQGTLSPVFTLTEAFKSMAQAAASAGHAIRDLGTQATKLVASMAATAGAVAVAGNQLLKLPLGVLEKSIGSVGNEIARFVKLAQPGVFMRFQRSIDDLYASIGIALVPLLEKATQVFRTIGSAIYSLSANGQKALQVIAALSIGFVTLGAVMAGVAALSVVGAVGLTGFAAAMAIVEAVATGGIGPILSAIGYSLAFVGTAGSALAGVVAGLGTVMLAVSSVFTDLTPILNLLSNTFMTFMDNLGAAFKAFSNSGILLQLASMLDKFVGMIGTAIRLVAPALGSLLTIMGKFIPVIGQVIAAVAGVLLSPFIAAMWAVAKVFEVVGPMIEAFAEAFADVFTAIGSLVWDVVKAVGGLLLELVVLNPVFMLTMGVVKQIGIAFAAIALIMRDAILSMMDLVRAFLGFSIGGNGTGVKPPTDNTGAAAASVSTGRPEDALRKARESAFQMGTGTAKPDERTATNTDEIRKAIQDSRQSINQFFKDVLEFPNKIGEKAKEVAAETVVGIVDGLGGLIKGLNPLAANGPVGGVAGAADVVGDAIQKQLNRLNPFS